MKTDEKAKGKRIHRVVMLLCGAFMLLSGFAAAYLAFSSEGGIPGIFYSIHSLDAALGSAYRLPSSPSGPRPSPDWRPWSAEAFALAGRQNRLVLLDWTSGWSHGGHLMDEFTYADPQVRGWIAENVVAVRVDSDERPDLGRYLSSGWPTTAMLLPSGELLSSGTFMPPARFLSWARQIESGWRGHGDDIRAAKDAAKDRARAARESLLRRPSREWTAAAAKEATAAAFERLARDFDAANGGFGRGRKFPSPQTNRLLLELSGMGEPRAAVMARRTLDGQLRLMDPVWGGLYRYAGSPDWRLPRYEKLLSVQAQALRDLGSAYASTGEARYLRSAERIHDYLGRFSKSASGLHPAARDCDLRRPDGSWLEGDRYYPMREAQRLAAGLPATGGEYTASNAELVSALLTAGKDLGRPDWEGEGLALLETLWRRASGPRGRARHRLDRPGVEGLLEDELALAEAELLALRKTGQRRHLERVRLTLGFIASSLKDPESGGYRTRPASASGGPEKDWPAVDPDLTASAALLLLDAGWARDEAIAREGRRLAAWTAARPELTEPVLFARLALRAAQGR